MTRCNVDFFDYQLNYVHHDTIEVPYIDVDYLTPEASSILITETNNIPEKGIVHISEPINFVGIIDSTQYENYQTRVSFKPFITYFDQAVLFDIRLQDKEVSAGYPTLEQTLGNLINQYWGNGGNYEVADKDIERTQDDSKQALKIRVLDPISETSKWTFGIVSDEEKGKYAVVEFYNTLLENAMYRYRVSVEPTINLVDMCIDLTIGAPTGTFKIDADLPGVNINSFAINKMTSNINKIEFWNAPSLTSSPNAKPTKSNRMYYYLHPDGTYDTKDENRITPVVLEVMAITPGEDDNGNTISFAEACKQQAAEVFSDISWTNYIELEFGNYDTLVNAKKLRIGQEVSILHNGEWYNTILTGKKLSETTTLIFGTIRVDLTKKNQLAANKSVTVSKTITGSASTGSGSGGQTIIQGTTNYNELENKPSIEGVTLEGDKTYPELNLKEISSIDLDGLLTM